LLQEQGMAFFYSSGKLHRISLSLVYVSSPIWCHN
jgi:hypothetical protein